MKEYYQNILSKIDSDIDKISIDKTTKLIIVSKSQPTSSIRELIKSGYHIYGENYLDEAIKKIEEIDNNNLEWHFIGRIQSNKIKKIAKYFNWVQTISSEKHARLLNEECQKLEKKLNICVQINIDNEESKAGIMINETDEFLNNISRYEYLSLRGIMAIPSKLNALKENVNSYNILKLKYDKLSNKYKNIDTLSLGMSNDYKLALSKGSNMIRIGSLIFGERK